MTMHFSVVFSFFRMKIYDQNSATFESIEKNKDRFGILNFTAIFVVYFTWILNFDITLSIWPFISKITKHKNIKAYTFQFVHA